MIGLFKNSQSKSKYVVEIVEELLSHGDGGNKVKGDNDLALGSFFKELLDTQGSQNPKADRQH